MNIINVFAVAVLNLIGWFIIWLGVDKELKSVKYRFVITGIVLFIISFFISTVEVSV